MNHPDTRQWNPGDLQSLTRLSVELIYDSSCDRHPIGVRSAEPTSRHVLYRAGGLLVDLRFEHDPGTFRDVVVGQVADRKKPAGPAEQMPVLLLQEDQVVTHMVSNEFGEFHTVYEPHEGMSLGVVFGDEWLVQIPLGAASPDGQPAGL